MNELKKLAGSSLLGDIDRKKFYALCEDVDKSFSTAQVFRTDTEMRLSVLGDYVCPTPDAKYWQAVREQDVHAQELVHLDYEHKKALIELKRLDRKLQNEKDDIEIEALELEISHQKYICLLMERQAHHRLREIDNWCQIKNELRPLLKHGDSDVNLHQLEAMRIRWNNEARLVSSHTPPADAFNIIGLAESTNGAAFEKLK